MEIEQILKRNFQRIDRIYDLIAICYDYIIDTVKRQDLFIGAYIIKNDETDVSNPNLPQLWDFSEQVVKTLKQRDKEGLEFEICLKKLLIKIEWMRKSLQDYREKALNKATIPYFLLMGTDRYLQEKEVKLTEKAPLNKGYQEKSYVYINRNTYLLKEAVESDFPSAPIRKLTIRNQLSCILILEKKELPEEVENPPQIVPLWISEMDTERQKILAGKKLTVAVIPFGSIEMLEFPVQEGGLFTVNYKEEHLAKGRKRAIRLLKKAIAVGANIIIFPEFVCHIDIQEGIKESLEELYYQNPEKIKDLLLVIAGSRWSESNNNICRIYSYSGEILGEQYKYSAYSDMKKRGKEMIENLTEPGKEVTVVEVPGIGRVLVGICRDVSEGEYTFLLAKAFYPQFLLVPAWSKSVYKGFSQQFKNIVSDNHITCSILCNCCEAFKGSEFRETNGIVVAPTQKGSVFKGKVSKISRLKDCNKSCGKGGCVFLVHLNFSVDNFKNKRIVEQIQQRIV